MKDAVARLTEEALYEQVASEIASGVRREGLWAKALVECGGSPERARALYLRLRVQSLLDEAEIQRIAELERLRKAEVEARRQEQERIDNRVAELREQEQKTSTFPSWVIAFFALSVVLVAYKLFIR